MATDDLVSTIQRDGWLYRFEAVGTSWKRIAFFTMPIAKYLRKCPTRLFVGKSEWAFSSCRYQNGALTDTFYLLRSPTCLEMWDPLHVRSSGEWMNGKLPLNVGLPSGFHVVHVAAAGPYLAIAGTVSGRETVAYRAYNADLVGIHPLLTYNGLVDWTPGLFASGLKRVLTLAGFNIPPLNPVILQGCDGWKLLSVRPDSTFRLQVHAHRLCIDGTYEISYRQAKLAVRRIDALVVPSKPPVIEATPENDYDWVGQPEFPATRFDQCVNLRDGVPIFCRPSLLDFLRADGDGTLVDARGMPC